MSQDGGQFSSRRPRETLGNLTNYQSALPIYPPSTMKRSTQSTGMQPPGSAGGYGNYSMSGGPRQSLAMSSQRPSQPLFGRASSGGADLGMSAVKRASFQAQNATAIFKNWNATPAQANRSSVSEERRSSVYRAGRASGGTMASHQSFFQAAPQLAGVPKDPRPLRDRNYQARIGQELVDYLAQNNFEMEMKYVLSQNVLRSPTQKDFNMMFQWLYHRLDPSHKFQKNIDQEVPPLLAQIRYPFAKGITKSQIAAVGGQNWSLFLGLLHWMVQLAKMLDGYVAHKYDHACAEVGVDVTGDAIIFDFLSVAYKGWLAMDDDATDEEAKEILAPHIARMAHQFEDSIAMYTEHLQDLESEHAQLAEEIAKLEKAAPDLATLDKHHQIMEEDRIKFEVYNQQMNQRSEKYESKVEVLREELEKLNVEHKELEEERKGLQQAVDDQNLSMQDIDRMNSERERLQKGIEGALQRLDEAKRKVSEKETDASGKLDNLERMVEKYNTVAYQIGLIPSSAVNAKGVDYELGLTVNNDSSPKFTASQLGQREADSEGERLLIDATTGYQPHHVLNLDLRGTARSALLNLKKDISERRGQAMDTVMKDHELLDQLKEAMEDKRNEVDALEHRVRAADAEHERTKEVTMAQRMASDAQIEKMEKDLAKMRGELSESVQLLEQREMNTSIEYEQLTLKANALREELHTEIMRMLNDVIKFKMHVQKNLEDYEGFVADELEKELESGEAKDDA